MGGLKRLFGRFRERRRADHERQSAAPVDWVIAGLGNPEPKYQRSRHNSGFMTLDRLARTHGVELSRRRFKGVVAEARFGESSILLVKPETYYNLSGECIGAILGYFHAPPERLIVIHDELDLALGRLRLKRGGGSAGNRGVISVEDALGTPEFVRVRVGIGRFTRDEDDKDYLLRAMTDGELEAFAPTIGRAADAVEAVVAQGLERAMNLFNQRGSADRE